MKKILKPFSRIYQFGMSVRNRLYSSNLIRQINPPVFTISIGNISWGGTGKTPLCEFLLNFFHKQGINPLLLTRGYRGKPPRYPYLVKGSDPVCFTGDEPIMLKKLCPFANIIVDPIRERGIFFAWKKFKPDIAILDDGFQYIKLKRHLNVILFSIEDLTKNWNKIIPYGTWRERANSIYRADILMVNITGQEKDKIIKFSQKKLEHFKKPIFFFETKITSITDIEYFKNNKKEIPTRYILFAGIGNPDKVYKSANDYIGFPPIKFIKYPDHYKYTKKDIFFLKTLAKKYKSSLITTQKDAVKLTKFSDREIYALKLKTEIYPGPYTEKSFEETVTESFFKYKSSH